jgi:hypothetical protein
MYRLITKYNIPKIASEVYPDDLEERQWYENWLYYIYFLYANSPFQLCIDEREMASLTEVGKRNAQINWWESTLTLVNRDAARWIAKEDT